MRRREFRKTQVSGMRAQLKIHKTAYQVQIVCNKKLFFKCNNVFVFKYYIVCVMFLTGLGRQLSGRVERNNRHKPAKPQLETQFQPNVCEQAETVCCLKLFYFILCNFFNPCDVFSANQHFIYCTVNLFDNFKQYFIFYLNF